MAEEAQQQQPPSMHIRPNKRSGTKTVPRSILKASKYTASTATPSPSILIDAPSVSDPTTTLQQQDVSNDTHDDDDALPEWLLARRRRSSDGPILVQESVVERHRGSSTQPQKDASQQQQQTTTPPPFFPDAQHSQAIEGYVPQTTESAPTTMSSHTPVVPKRKEHASNQQPQNKVVDNDNDELDDDEHDDDDDDDQPYSFNSLADMMEMAGTLPENQNDPHPQAIEAQLSFACVPPDEYRQQQRAVCLGRASPFLDNNDDSDNDERNENTSPVSNDDNENDDSAWALFGGDLSEEEEEEDAPPPRSFLILHTAIAQWVRPLAVRYIQDRCKNNNNNRHYYAPETPQSDIELSRCAALMDVLQLHLDVCMLQELVWPSETVPLQSTIEASLAEWVSHFDYQCQAPVLNLAQAKALTCVLVGTLLYASHSQTTTTTTTVPTCCAELGMTVEEFRYLTQSAFLSFASRDEEESDEAKD